jgi:hypothetical protein
MMTQVGCGVQFSFPNYPKRSNQQVSLGGLDIIDESDRRRRSTPSTHFYTNQQVLLQQFV